MFLVFTHKSKYKKYTYSTLIYLCGLSFLQIPHIKYWKLYKLSMFTARRAILFETKGTLSKILSMLDKGHNINHVLCP